MSRVALCACGCPLVCTFAFSGYEFYCLDCGRLYGWFDPEDAAKTTENMDRLRAVMDEWAEVGPHLLSGGIMLTVCQACKETGRPHATHATPDELAAHEDALERLRVRRAPGVVVRAELTAAQTRILAEVAPSDWSSARWQPSGAAQQRSGEALERKALLAPDGTGYRLTPWGIEVARAVAHVEAVR